MAVEKNPVGGPSVRPTDPSFKCLSTREGYDRWASFYDDEDNALILLEEREFPCLLGPIANLKILDTGCGTGRQSHRLAAAGADVTAIDFSEKMLEKAGGRKVKNGVTPKKHADSSNYLGKDTAGRKGLEDVAPPEQHLRFLHHDLLKRWPFEPASFDLVTCCLVLDHIVNLEFFFGEMRRVLRFEGRVLISVIHPAMLLRGITARFTDPETGQEIRPESAEHQISEYVMAATGAGFCIETMREFAVDEALMKVSPRARKYADWPLLLLFALRPTLQEE